MRRFGKLHTDKRIGIICRLLLVALLVFLGMDCAQAADPQARKAAIVVSRNIRPYVEAVEGMSAVFTKSTGVGLQVWYLDKFPANNRIALSEELATGGFSLFIAVGPEAARFIRTQNLPEDAVRIYSVILNPKQVLGESQSICGVSLNIPAQKQIEMIRRSLPELSRIGVLYDPRYNTDFVEEAFRSMPGELLIVPLAISSKKDIPNVLQRHWGDVDALWLIPDRTVISESIIAYVIKESLFKKVPVIGYNRFFYDSGSAFAFVFDYEELGRQCAREALTLLSKGECRRTSPLFHVWINTRVMKKLGLPIADEYPLPIEVKP